MDPEDVVDFGEDDDGLDVISLGGSDHNRDPVAHHSSSAAQPACGRFIKSPSGRRSYSRSASSRNLNGSDKRPRDTLSKPTSSKAPPIELPHRHFLHSADRRPSTDSSRHSNAASSPSLANRPSAIDLPRRAVVDRSMPPHRLTNMSSDCLPGLEASEPMKDSLHSNTHSSPSLHSSSNRIPNNHPINFDPSTSLPSSKSVTENENFPITSNSVVPDSTNIDADTSKLPPGWIIRISSTGKTYYVNEITRISQWAVPTEPATGKKARTSTYKSTSKAISGQSVPQPIESGADFDKVHDEKSAVIDLTASSPPVMTKPQTQKSLAQTSVSSQSSNLQQSDLKRTSPSNMPTTTSPSDSCRQPEACKLTLSESAPKTNSATDSIPLSDKLNSRVSHSDNMNAVASESFSRDPRLHPDRRPEIGLANFNRIRERTLDNSKAISSGSFHRDLPVEQTRNTYIPARHGEPIRHLSQFDPRHPRVHPLRHRSRSSSPPARRLILPKFPLDRERPPRETVHLSGANGLPTGTPRPFGNERTMIPHSETVRYVKESKHDGKMISPKDNQLKDFHHPPRRHIPDYSAGRDAPYQGPRLLGDPRRESLRSPVSASHRHGHMARVRSPSPPSRRVMPFEDMGRAHPQRDLYLPGRERIPTRTGRAFDERSSKHMGPIEPVRREYLPRYDTYRPSLESNEFRRNEPRRGAAHSPRYRDQVLYRDGHEKIINKPRSMPPREPLVSQTSKLPKDVHQPDLYRPSRHIHPRISLGNNEPTRVRPSSELKEPSKDQSSTNQPTPSRSPDKPSGPPAPSKTTRQTSDQESAKNVQNSVPQSPHTLDDFKPLESGPHQPEPISIDTGKAEMSHQKPEASVDLVDKCQPASESSISSQKKPLSLANRLGPIVHADREYDLVEPPAKKHKANFEEPIEITVIEDSPVSNHDGSPIENAEMTPTHLVSSALELEILSETIAIHEQVSPHQSVDLSHRGPLLNADKGIALRGRALRQIGKVQTIDDKEKQAKSGLRESEANVGRSGQSSLRERIQDLDFPPSEYLTSHLRPLARDSDNEGVKHLANEQSPSSSRHISERISGLKPSHYMPPMNGGQRYRHVNRQSDSGWNGRKLKYP
ncbi:hypothetical protein O181_013477 [Austropuccinia psidii MF-1]|uniref:WW domain-containing protein n=1 Tax=Austropuccinia psidii MF-1 TaxID=1389203 RepID=A0A9Q3BZQ2_9BASI|nr:hypothetical protein [Austropuccinia psidii MF-1]